MDPVDVTLVFGGSLAGFTGGFFIGSYSYKGCTPSLKLNSKESALLKIGLYIAPPRKQKDRFPFQAFSGANLLLGLGSDFFPKDPWEQS